MRRTRGDEREFLRTLRRAESAEPRGRFDRETVSARRFDERSFSPTPPSPVRRTRGDEREFLRTFRQSVSSEPRGRFGHRGEGEHVRESERIPNAYLFDPRFLRAPVFSRSPARTVALRPGPGASGG